MLLLCMPGCKKAEDVTIAAAKPERTLESFFGKDIGTNRPKLIHLYSDTVYTISQSMTREAGEQLVIDAGTVIKSSGAGITINPDGVLLANGTQENPIVFTSLAAAGTQGPNWGGIVIKGKSYDNENGVTGDPLDFSGSLQFVRIEFAGLTLTGVGSGTTVENVEVSYTRGRPAFEIDGGTFNARHLLSYACGGAADFYITRGYSGKMQYVFAYRHPFFGTRNGGQGPYNALTGVFIENNPNDTSKKPYTSPILSNITVLGPNGQNGSPADYSDTLSRSAALITTGNARFRIRNSLFMGFPVGAWYIDDLGVAAGIATQQSEFTSSIVQSNDSTRAFYLVPGTFGGTTSADFKNYMLAPSLHNHLYANAGDFMFKDPFNYDAPNPFPKDGSPVLTGADFTGANFSDAFFTPVAYIGAMGSDNWLLGWVNFTPLKTNYNFPR